MQNTSVLLGLYRILDRSTGLEVDFTLFLCVTTGLQEQKQGGIPTEKARTVSEQERNSGWVWCGTWQGFCSCENIFALKVLSSGEYFSTLMTKLQKLALFLAHLGGQPCEALCEGDLLVLWGHLVAKERMLLASKDHLQLTGPRERIQKVSV